MADIHYLRCRHCGEPLVDRTREYCPPCNLYLAYRAMPLILGMLLLAPLAANRRLAPATALLAPEARGYDDETVLIWE